jgi:hypothetical protein
VGFRKNSASKQPNGPESKDFSKKKESGIIKTENKASKSPERSKSKDAGGSKKPKAKI